MTFTCPYSLLVKNRILFKPGVLLGSSFSVQPDECSEDMMEDTLDLLIIAQLANHFHKFSINAADMS
jgi:hypothetical protein